MEQQVVVFKIGKAEYGLPINLVREIIKTPQTTRIPNTPKHIEGVINLRGKVIPVMDLRKLFNVEAGEGERVIVLDVTDQTIGVMVDQVNEVLKISDESIEAPPNLTESKENNIVEGIGKLDERLLILLNPDKILTSSNLDKEIFIEIQEEIKKMNDSIT